MFTITRIIFAVSVVAFLSMSISSCSMLKASPKKETLFIKHPERLSEGNDRVPFNNYWVRNPEAFYELRKRNGKTFIAPINLDAIKIAIRKKLSDDPEEIAHRIEETQEIARYFRERLKIAIRKFKKEEEFDPIISFVDSEEEASLKLSLAITEIEPGNPTTNLCGAVVGFIIPFPISFPLEALIESFGVSSMAIEGSIEEIATKTTYGEIKDREKQKQYLFTFKNFHRYAHIRVAVDDWSEQIVKLLNTKPSVKVDDSLPFGYEIF